MAHLVLGRVGAHAQSDQFELHDVCAEAIAESVVDAVDGIVVEVGAVGIVVEGRAEAVDPMERGKVIVR